MELFLFHLLGYGNMTPETHSGKCFVILYAIIGIPFTGVVIAKLSGVLTNCVKKFDNLLAKCITTMMDKFEKDELKEKLNIRITQLVIVIVMFTIFFWMIPAAALSKLEDWTLTDSMYYCFVSFTTIGLGDYVPGSSGKHIRFGKPSLSQTKIIGTQVGFV